MTTVAELPAGFADKVMSAQSTFRSVMDAMARPGSVQQIGAVAGSPANLMRGTAAIALTLFDHDTPVWLDPSMAETTGLAKWLKFHTGAPVVADASICSFALIGDPAHHAARREGRLSHVCRRKGGRARDRERPPAAGA